MKKNKKSIAYIFPNLLTSASVFSGVYSIINSINHEYKTAAWLIFIALIFDGLDGRVARLTNSCSRFGLEYDSLADIVSFGMAPAVLLYQFAAHDYGRVGIVATALYVIFGAIRLARFNITSQDIEPSVFIGVPIPTAAVFVSLLTLFFQKYNFDNSGIVLISASIVVALLMVSNIRYPSFKKLDTQKQYNRKILIYITMMFLTIFIWPIEGIVLLFSVYIFYGPVRTVYNLLRKR